MNDMRIPYAISDLEHHKTPVFLRPRRLRKTLLIHFLYHFSPHILPHLVSVGVVSYPFLSPTSKTFPLYISMQLHAIVCTVQFSHFTYPLCLAMAIKHIFVASCFGYLKDVRE